MKSILLIPIFNFFDFARSGAVMNPPRSYSDMKSLVEGTGWRRATPKEIECFNLLPSDAAERQKLGEDFERCDMPGSRDPRCWFRQKQNLMSFPSGVQPFPGAAINKNPRGTFGLGYDWSGCDQGSNSVKSCSWSYGYGWGGPRSQKDWYLESSFSAGWPYHIKIKLTAEGERNCVIAVDLDSAFTTKCSEVALYKNDVSKLCPESYIELKGRVQGYYPSSGPGAAPSIYEV